MNIVVRGDAKFYIHAPKKVSSISFISFRALRYNFTRLDFGENEINDVCGNRYVSVIQLSGLIQEIMQDLLDVSNRLLESDCWWIM